MCDPIFPFLQPTPGHEQVCQRNFEIRAMGRLVTKQSATGSHRREHLKRRAVRMGVYVVTRSHVSVCAMRVWCVPPRWGVGVARACATHASGTHRGP
jgi:hypothetical protein